MNLFNMSKQKPVLKSFVIPYISRVTMLICFLAFVFYLSSDFWTNGTQDTFVFKLIVIVIFTYLVLRWLLKSIYQTKGKKSRVSVGLSLPVNLCAAALALLFHYSQIEPITIDDLNDLKNYTDSEFFYLKGTIELTTLREHAHSSYSEPKRGYDDYYVAVHSGANIANTLGERLHLFVRENVKYGNEYNNELGDSVSVIKANQSYERLEARLDEFAKQGGYFKKSSPTSYLKENFSERVKLLPNSQFLTAQVLIQPTAEPSSVADVVKIFAFICFLVCLLPAFYRLYSV